MNDSHEPEWKSRLEWHKLFGNPFSMSSGWQTWLERLKHADDAEYDRLDALQRQYAMGQTSQDKQAYRDYDNDVLADMAFQAKEISNNMHAVLIVALWSKMETELKQLAGICCVALSLKEPSYKFEPLKNFLDTCISIDMERYIHYSEVNAIRVLNNSFKHSGGYYRPDSGKTHTQIDQSLESQFSLVRGSIIDYSRLPIEELVGACSEFSDQLRDEIAERFDVLTGGTT